MSDIVCRRCGWLTYAFETYCHVCGWNRWDNDHVSVPTLWCDLTGWSV